MFSSRLHPTRPPAAHRAVLERVGAGCRAIREAAATGHEDTGQLILAEFSRRGVFGIGIDKDYGGAGTDPLLGVLAAERIGREGLDLGVRFARHAAAVAAIVRFGNAEQKSRWLQAAAQGEVVLEGGVEKAAESLIAELGDAEAVERCVRRQFRLLLAGAGVGVMSDCLEETAEHLGGRGSRRADPDAERSLAWAGTDLEAARGLAYAAAELKREHDRNPESLHLEKEADALIAESYWFALRAAQRGTFSAMRLVGEASRAGRHRAVFAAILPELEPTVQVQSDIAKFYLD